MTAARPYACAAASCSSGPATSSSATSGPHPSISIGEMDERWGHPRFVIDVAPGAGDTFSLEGRDDLHFTLIG